MDWNVWLIDKAFLLVLLFVMMKITAGMFKGMIAWAYAYISQQLAEGNGFAGGKAPTIKQAAGVAAMHAAPAIGKQIGRWIEGIGKNG